MSLPSNPPAILKSPPPALLEVPLLALDALQMTGEFVAQFVDGAAGFGGVDVVFGRGRGRGQVPVDLAQRPGEAGERMQGAAGAGDGLLLEILRVALGEAPERFGEPLAAAA